MRYPNTVKIYCVIMCDSKTSTARIILRDGSVFHRSENERSELDLRLFCFYLSSKLWPAVEKTAKTYFKSFVFLRAFVVTVIFKWTA